jgi:hypothetical protein
MLTDMTSWRDSASEQAQADMDDLLNVVLPFAEQTLAKHGELFPFGAAISTSGEAEMVAADLGDDQPLSQDLLDVLYEGGRASSGSRRAMAFVADVSVSGGDAIRVEVEHRDGLALQILVPYTRSRFRKAVTLGQMSAAPGNPHVWTAGG